MQVRTYTERSNARRAARAAGIDPALVFATEDGFTFPPPGGEDETPLKEAIDIAVDRDISPTEFTQIAENVADSLDISDYLKLSAEQRRAGWERNPPKIASVKPETASMAKSKTTKRKKAEKASGADKNATLLKMLAGKGSTVQALTKTLGWLPHTLRARISRLGKAKSKGGDGLKIERTREDGVTSYRIA